MSKLSDILNKWLESLDKDSRAQVEVLDGYFTFRRNLPEEDAALGRAIEEFKTTDDIIDDLLSMMPVSQQIVVEYLQMHEYHVTTRPDGTPVWAIWRFMEIV